MTPLDIAMQEEAHRACRRLAEGDLLRIDGVARSALVVVMGDAPEGLQGFGASLKGNMSSAAFMLGQLCQMAVREPRPTDCAMCAAAWDALHLAGEALKPVKGRC